MQVEIPATVIPDSIPQEKFDTQGIDLHLHERVYWLNGIVRVAGLMKRGEVLWRVRLSRLPQ